MPVKPCALAALLLFYPAAASLACPWCKSDPLRQPTVTASMTNAGGRFFGELPPAEKTREYFVAAEQVLWDFMPLKNDPIGRSPVPDRFKANVVMKSRYVQYTDATFTIRANEREHLGIVGPVLRANTGEFISVTFFNRTEQPLSMHPHGVRYDKDSEGASYFPDRGLGAAIGPGAKFIYIWHADEAAGPEPHEPSSKAWLYHSHVHAEREINSGLFGFLIITDPKRSRPDGTPADIDRELATAFFVFDERPPEDEDLFSVALPADPNLRQNFIQHRFNATVAELQQTELAARHSVNGRIFGNVTGLEMIQGERVRWYVFALGSEKDVHTAHWHGTRGRYNGRMTDVIELLPASIAALDFRADNKGTWLFQCHVADHMMEGMYAPFVVHEQTSTNSARLQLTRFYSPTRQAESFQIERLETARTDRGQFLKLTGTIRLNAVLPSTGPVECSIGKNTWKTDLADPALTVPNRHPSVQMTMIGNSAGTIVYRVVATLRSSLRNTDTGELPVTLRFAGKIFHGRSVQTH